MWMDTATCIWNIRIQFYAQHCFQIKKRYKTQPQIMPHFTQPEKHEIRVFYAPLRILC